MATITKEDVKRAFQNKTGKRNYLLYNFYKEEYFTTNLPASFIAEKISEDLGFKITRTMIYMVHHRIIKKHRSLTDSAPITNISSADLQTSNRHSEENKNQLLSLAKESDKEKVQEDASIDKIKQEGSLILINEKTGKEYVVKNVDQYPKKDPFNGAFDDF